MHPRVQKVFRNAVFFIFDHCQLGIVPAQFWPFLSATGDPGTAVALFIAAIGCDVERVRRGDRAEREKVADIIDFLVMSADVLDRLSPRAREELGRRLQSGDYATVRKSARIAAELRAALEVEEQWRGVGLLPSFENLMTTIRSLVTRPLSVTEDDAESAARLARIFSAAQTDFNELCSRYDAIASELADIWPATGWAVGPEEALLRSDCAGFETARDGLRSFSTLNVDQLQLALDQLRLHLENLERQLARAQAASGPSSSSGSGRSTYRSEKERLLDDALSYFGYSRSRLPSQSELRTRYRSMQADLHRRNPLNKEDEQKFINIYRDAIRDHLRDFTRAAA